MRILLWSDTFYPRIGGVEVMGAQFVHSLHARGHEVAIIAGPFVEHDSEVESFHGIPLYRFPFEFELQPYDMKMLVSIRQRLTVLLRNFQPEVFHLYHLHESFFLQRSNIKQIAGPTLLSLHSDHFAGGIPLTEARQQLCALIDWTAACSQNILEQTRALAPATAPKSSVIHNALAMPNCEPTPLNFDEPRILYVGRLHWHKGVDVALEAFARLHQRLAHTRFLIAGNGEEEAALQAQVERLSLQADVDFLGWIAPQDVPALINQATVMVVPSRLEAFGLSPVQGGQLARPVVATRVGGLPEVIIDGKTGLLVEPQDPDAMADALATILTEPERAKAMGEAARRYVQEHFSLAAYVDAYEELYTRLSKQTRIVV